MRILLASLLLGSAAVAAPLTPVANPDRWPAVAARPLRDPAIEARITDLLAHMSLDDKVGQMLDVDIGSITPADVVRYKIGAILNGGNSDPNNDVIAPPAEWLKLADAFFDASMTRTDRGPKIPVIWGTDAVHGNNNIFGATLFPHNIGLGAMRDRDLVRRIGEVTALETAAAGLDWTFAPTLAVVQDDRWGRTYESYSEEPQIQAAYAGAAIEGLEGRVGTADFLGPAHVIATTKHFLGDGGTGGRDQGDARVTEETLRDVHLGGYPAAIAAGTQSVMASFSSWNGVKMSGNRSLLTGVLKDRMHFDGFVVGDWNSHGQIPGCTNENCAAAINAGLDMFMYSGPNWKALYANTLASARSGEIPITRIDDAVARILRVKLRAGTFDRGRPSSRAVAGKFAAIGAAEHRAVARQAVRESLVLLKNENSVLPLDPHREILVAGKGADDISQAAGGWTLTWQGGGLPNSDFPHAESIWNGIRTAVAAAGGHATYSPDGTFTAKPAAAIVVFGEQPYAEFKGDRANLEYSPDDKADLALLAKLRAAGIPVVAVFLSGRPLWVNAELNASDAFVAAFLPGSEGGGIADLLFRSASGAIAHDFQGRLSFSWPKRPDQYVLNRRDPGYDPLFAFGYGLSYVHPGHVGRLDEARPAGMATGFGSFFAKGAVPAGWVMPPVEGLRVAAVDRVAQEDARALVWQRPAEFVIRPPSPLDLRRETNGEISLVVGLRLDAPDTATPSGISLVMVDAAGKRGVIRLRKLPAVSSGWATVAIPLQCFAALGVDMAHVAVPFALDASPAAALSISDVRLDYVATPMTACGGDPLPQHG